MPISIDLTKPLSNADAEFLVNDEAYLNPNHPNHHGAKQAVTNWFKANHPGESGLRKAVPVVIDSSAIFASTHAKPRS